MIEYISPAVYGRNSYLSGCYDLTESNVQVIKCKQLLLTRFYMDQSQPQSGSLRSTSVMEGADSDDSNENIACCKAVSAKKRRLSSSSSNEDTHKTPKKQDLCNHSADQVL